MLYRAQPDWAALSGEALDTLFADYAEQLGLDPAALRSCLASGRHTADVEADVEAATRFGVSGTPAFLVGGHRYEGALPIEAFRAILGSAP